jgi:hypothetical protein
VTRYQPPVVGRQPAAVDCPIVTGSATADASLPAADLSPLGAHLGWESHPVTAVLRQALANRRVEEHRTGQGSHDLGDAAYLAAPSGPPFTDCRTAVVPPVPEKAGENPGIKSYPDLNLAAVKAGEAALYRVWLLARHYDAAGQGWVATAVFKRALTGPKSAWRVCSRQRLNQILGQGHGRYWTFEQNGARLRYRGAAALAELLSVERLTGAPVYLSFRIVVGKVAGFKASLYAAWHAGRGKEGDRRPRPVSRATLAEKAGVSARTLQRYDRQAGVKRERHMAVGGRHNETAAQEHAWQRGRAAFTFVDYEGRQGRVGGVYLAHNLPNSYEANLSRAARGRQRKINKQLNQPRDSVARGNGAGRIFHADGAAAGKAYNRQPDRDAYWPMQATRGDGRVWAVISAR